MSLIGLHGPAAAPLAALVKGPDKEIATKYPPNWTAMMTTLVKLI